MRKPVLLALTLLLSAPALAWVPKLEETTAKNVIDGAYGRREPVPTYLTLDLNVKDGQFASGPGAVKVFDGGEKCLADWLAAPGDFAAGSRPAAVTVSGQADQLYFQAVDARDNFQVLSAEGALGADLTAKRMAEGLLRVDVNVRGLPSEKARDAYLLRLRAPDGKLVAPVRKSFVNDWKPMVGAGSTTAVTPPATSTTPATTVNTAVKGPLEGTLVYYFEPLKAGIGASDKVELLIRTEADTSCAYSVTLDLGSFQ
ncbi:hypothetical protein [Deinococcus budaensis]|uniref:Uncharacterized protein n=1 Tax=Deinococcus budaensis TaxID=1665626 RepID=A0A7W8GG53_9DEIO|nr:hypothetical protein [Deinococcus budaensis]MBB5234990.1 hypothetical protein [Deinococcus budaensis]